ncbi:hypothetical protein D0T84_01410 [Dysgonomonas sp. 521]|uniref:hypothetical protein n=1 Tax=Dysgonomonas sp. 521 TaxID=2302932 RepID=UPI0013D8BFFE|nr:hypothetical protein [Dysgonomonas sp. 521]NDV93575.1 hypothetical protein [Dysgonomonas sp. 521]
MSGIDTDFFNETQEGFTIYVVEQRFVVGRGSDFFKTFRGKKNMITTSGEVKKIKSKIYQWIGKNISNITDLMTHCFFTNIAVDIPQIINNLAKLFSVHEHQAAGPEIIDPILIQEGNVTNKDLAELISLYKSSILRPVIVILLKDNDFDRARTLLSLCPHGILVKMIRNDGSSELDKIINTGVEDVESFIDIFTRQCFSACSKTARGVLYNKEWAENSIVKLYAPSILRLRTNLLYDLKDNVREDVCDIIKRLQNEVETSHRNNVLTHSFSCMSKLFRVYCNDYGGQDIQDALDIAKYINNDILSAHVYRYAHFMKDVTLHEKNLYLSKAQEIFSKNGMEDHMVYCMNNELTNQFYTDQIGINQFEAMKETALFNVPGLVGMSIILNNVGVAYLYSGKLELAIDILNKAKDYAKTENRVTQELGILCNLMVVKDYYGEDINEKEIYSVLRRIFDHFDIQKGAFLSANYITNIIAISLKYKGLLSTLFDEFEISDVLNNALKPNLLGVGSLNHQLYKLTNKHSELKKLFSYDVLSNSNMPKTSGIRQRFISNNGMNPSIFNAWL